MELKIVGLIAAMPGEIRPLLKIAGEYSKTKAEGFNLYGFSIAGRPCRLIESGIGMKRAARAVQTLINGFKPEIIISFGFGGAVLPGMSAGDLAIAGRSFIVRQTFPDAGETIGLSVPPNLLPTLENIGKKFGFSVREGDFLTSDKILSKKELAGFLPGDMTNPVLDMETWAIARETVLEKVPLLAIRAVSDAADEELEFSLDRFTDREMNIRISRILLTIASKPRILPQLIRLAGNSRIAGRNLAVALHELLQMESTLSAP
jgi:adenosylhomocysteine nucleosidase